MGWTEGFIAVDWGTTNRRAYLIEADGRQGEEMADDLGIRSVAWGGFPDAVEQIKHRLGPLPMLMGGMIGSNRGWVEAPYVPCPASLQDLLGALKWPEPGETAIIPGVSYASGEDADVMRGEETQILGAHAAGLVADDCLICHPGTHNKWARLEQGRLVSFRTIMTGELFNLMREHSILADLLSEPSDTGAAFEAGVRHGLAHDDLAGELFAVRARVLLGRGEAKDAPSYVSGLLIGGDLRLALRDVAEGEVVVMGGPTLTKMYARALAIAGRRTREVDGEAAFIAGAKKLAEMMT